MESSKTGILSALAAFLMWGILPVFWKLLSFLPPPSIVAQRTVWSLVVLSIICFLRGEWRHVVPSLAAPQALRWHLLSGLMLSSNWLLYVWATLNGRIIEAALGYYLNPFFNMLFGALWFGEKHNRLQRGAILLALAGVAVQLPAAGHFPWLALTLAITFSLYGVVRKRAPLGALAGLTVETLLLAPIAFGWLVITSDSIGQSFGGTWSNAGLVIGTGLATAFPLLCFGNAARTISLTTLGILQFLGPTLQFLIGWQFYGEPLTAGHLYTFGLIWLAIGIYAIDSFGRKKSAPSG